MKPPKTEAELLKQVSAWLKENRGPQRSTIEPIENAVNLGTFDTFAADDGIGVWLELKVAGPRAKPGIRSGQPAFGERMFRAGVRARILVSHPDGSCRLLDGRATDDDWRDWIIWEGGLEECLVCVFFRHSFYIKEGAPAI